LLISSSAQNDVARDRQICIDRRASLPRPAPTLGALRTAQEPDVRCAVDGVELGPEAPFCVLHGGHQAVISVASLGAPRGVEHGRVTAITSRSR
jgi:hypothetical protein